ncbi:MAG: DNA-directed RNA polymerase subunit omega [Campylobacter sp.]|nr:DNA-directed RNA polymerase subunit omega [Campylobacter sp.]
MRPEDITAKALKRVNGDRYKLSLMVAKRANQLHLGDDILVDVNKRDLKFADIALLEIAQGKVELDGIIETEK